MDPPVPLILAASGASDHSKHMRLAEQLEWAREIGALDEAIVRLKEIAPHCWNRGSLDRWDEDNYY